MAKYLVDSLKDDGLHTSKVTNIVRVRIGEVHFAPEGTVLAHPRAGFPAKPSLVEEMRGGYDNAHPMTVRDGGMVKGVRRFLIINGAMRKIAGTVVEKEERAAGKLKATDGHYMVAVRVFDGTDLECLMERARLNSDPTKTPDSPSVLFVMYAAMEKEGATHEQIGSVCPAGVDVAAILRWKAIHSDVQALLDAHPSPFGMLAALLDVPRDDQPTAYADMIAMGATTPQKARRVARKATGSERAPSLRLPSPRAFEAMRGAVNGETVKAMDIIDFFLGRPKALTFHSPEVAALLTAARDNASKPGRKPAKGGA